MFSGLTVLGVATLVFVAARPVARRLGVFADLLNMSRAFRDPAPSRLSLAYRCGDPETVRRMLRSQDSGSRAADQTQLAALAAVLEVLEGKRRNSEVVFRVGERSVSAQVMESDIGGIFLLAPRWRSRRLIMSGAAAVAATALCATLAIARSRGDSDVSRPLAERAPTSNSVVTLPTNPGENSSGVGGGAPSRAGSPERAPTPEVLVAPIPTPTPEPGAEPRPATVEQLVVVPVPTTDSTTGPTGTGAPELARVAATSDDVAVAVALSSDPVVAAPAEVPIILDAADVTSLGELPENTLVGMRSSLAVAGLIAPDSRVVAPDSEIGSATTPAIARVALVDGENPSAGAADQTAPESWTGSDEAEPQDTAVVELATTADDGCSESDAGAPRDR